MATSHVRGAPPTMLHNSFDGPGLGARHVVVVGLDALDLAADATLDQLGVGPPTHGPGVPDQSEHELRVS